MSEALTRDLAETAGQIVFDFNWEPGMDEIIYDFWNGYEESGEETPCNSPDMLAHACKIVHTYRQAGFEFNECVKAAEIGA